MQSQVGELLRSRDFVTLARIMEDRWGIVATVETLEHIHDIAFRHPSIAVGGAGDDPWSDSTWLLWIKNRVNDLATKPRVADVTQSLESQRFAPPGSQVEWREFLQRYSRELLATDDSRIAVPEDARLSQWMGYPPATESAIAESERRLGRPLPPSLRCFYSVSNGWRATGYFIYNVLPVEAIGWLRDVDPPLYHLADEAESTRGPWPNDPDAERLKEYRNEQGTRVKRTLVISSEGDGATWLLDPGPEPHSGEWPGGRWAGWNPAMAWTAGSFAELMAHELGALIDLRQNDVS